ncbi:unnamed protein product [Bathycoccus prasinos]
MCIMVKEIGNGNPKNDKMYLLNKITPEERPIQVATLLQDECGGGFIVILFKKKELQKRTRMKVENLRP